MPYQAPARDEISQFVIDPPYKKKDNPDRLLSLKLLDGLYWNSNTDDEILIGAILLGINTIDAEPKYRFLNSNGYWGINKGSELKKEYKKLLKVRDEDKNPLDDRKQYVYFEKLYNYLNNNRVVAEKIITSLNQAYQAEYKQLGKKDAVSRWPTVDALLDDVANNMSAILQKQDNRRGINGLLKGLPALSRLKGKIAEAISKYKSLYEPKGEAKPQRKKHNPKRDLAIHMLELANNTCDKYYPLTDDEKITDDNLHHLEQRYSTRMGAMLMVMKEIEADYGLTEWMFWPPEMSELYRYCQEALNIKRSTDLDSFTQGRFLKSLFSYIDNIPVIAKDPEKYNISAEAVTNLYKNWKMINWKLHSFTQPVEDLPTNISGKAGGYAKYGTEFVFNSGVVTLTDMICVPAIGKKAVKAVGGAIGYAIFGPGGALLGAYAAGLAVDKVLPGYVALPFVTCLQPIGNALGKAAGGLVTVAVYPLEKGFRMLVTSDQKLTEQQVHAIIGNSEFLESLLRSPDKVFSSEEKDKLDTIVGNAKPIENTYQPRYGSAMKS